MTDLSSSATSDRVPTARRPWLRRVVVLGLILVGVEVGLQLLAYFELRGYQRWYSFRGDASKRRVVCLGDGLTFGVGTSTSAASYPAQLQEQLGADWAVRNFGAVGMDSGQALERLGVVLAEERPEFVCLSIGRVDAQVRPRKVDSPRVGARFEWRLQCLSWLPDSPQVAGNSAFVGDWHFGAVSFRFGEDHSVSLAGAKGSWSYAGSGLTVRLDDGVELSLSFRVEGEKLRLFGDFPGGEVVVSSGLPPSGTEREIEQLLRREAYEEAAWYCDVILRGAEPSHAVRALRSEAAWLAGDRRRAIAELEILVSELAGEDPQRLVARCKWTMGDDEAGRELQQFCREHPEARYLVDDVAWRAGGVMTLVDPGVTRAHVVQMIELCRVAGAQLLIVSGPDGLLQAGEGEGWGVDTRELWRDPSSRSIAGYGSDPGYRRLAEILAAVIKGG